MLIEDNIANFDLVSTDMLLRAYSIGLFPMADPDSGEIRWYSPIYRAIFPLHHLKEPRSLRQYKKKINFEFSINTDFESVINSCGNRDDTWINEKIIGLYVQFHKLGFAHSVETWLDGKLVGGLYGVSIGAAFFGESMFNNVTNASKAAFYFLVEHLISRNYQLLDSQFINHHTKMLGAVEVPRKIYNRMLNKALNSHCTFY